MIRNYRLLALAVGYVPALACTCALVLPARARACVPGPRTRLSRELGRQWVPHISASPHVPEDTPSSLGPKCRPPRPSEVEEDASPSALPTEPLRSCTVRSCIQSPQLRGAQEGKVWPFVSRARSLASSRGRLLSPDWAMNKSTVCSQLVLVIMLT